MLKSYFMVFLILITMINMILAQNDEDYKNTFIKLIEGVKNENEYYTKVYAYLNAMEVTELSKALSSISMNKDVNFIAYNLFSLIDKKKYRTDIFQNKLLAELEKEQNSANFRIIAMDFLSKYIEINTLQRKKFNNILRNITLNEKVPESVRYYAINHLPLTSNENELLKKLLRSQNQAVRNAAALKIKRLFQSNIKNTEKLFWVDELLNIINDNKRDIYSMDKICKSLAYSKTDRARNALLNLFLQIDPIEKETLNACTRSLTILADKEVLNTIFNTYDNAGLTDYNSEMALTYLAEKNLDILEIMSFSSVKEDKLNFLRAVRLIRTKDKEKYLEKIKNMLKDESEYIRLEAVKTIHYLLPYENEKIIFSEHFIKENSKLVKDEIRRIVGIR